MKKLPPLLIVIVALAIAAVIAIFHWPSATSPQTHPVAVTPSSTSVAAGNSSSTAKLPSQKAAIPQGSQTYQIMQAASVMPKIVQVTVDPVNVHVGDVQTLTAIISDPNPITSVVANIQTDNGTTTVPLLPVGPAALNDVAPPRYFVNDDNQLALAPPVHQSEGNVAFAATGDEKYSGEWTVKDTHTARYKTEFTATDAKGNSNSATFGWTDAVCSWNGDNNNSGATTTISATFGSQGCTFTNGVTDGVENGNLLMALRRNL